MQDLVSLTVWNMDVLLLVRYEARDRTVVSCIDSVDVPLKQKPSTVWVGKSSLRWWQ